MEQVKAETGCTHIINGGFFEALTKPCPMLKINGKWIASADYTAWGFSWNNAEDIVCESSAKAKANFFSCVDLVNPSDGNSFALRYNSDVGGARARTAWGILRSGKHLLYVSSVAKTPEQLRKDLCMMYDIVALQMCDSGSSTQGDFDGWKLSASRRVANFICFWAEDINTDDADQFADAGKKEESKSMLLKKGSKGDAVRELQNNLNALINAGLTMDGDFGAATEKAVKKLQSCWAISADGVAGDNTQAAIAEIKATLAKQDTLRDKLVSKAVSELGAAEPDGDDKYIKAYNAETGAGFGLNVSWCQIFQWYILSFFNIKSPVTASCTAAVKEYTSSGQFHGKDYKPIPGDLVYYDWDGSGDADHVGLVISSDNDYIYTIEGNVTTGVGDAVARQIHNRTANYIRGYASPLGVPESVKDDGKTYTVVFHSKEAAEYFAAVFGGDVVIA